MIVQIMSIIIWLILAPFCCGMSLVRYMRKEQQNIAMIMVTGYFLLLALFQIIYIPFIVFYNHFRPLVIVYEIVILVYSIGSIYWNGSYFIKKSREKVPGSMGTYILWAVALLLIGFQLYKMIFFQFLDGDDAFYAVTSVITYQNNNMYVKLPYTGEASTLDVRHAFSAAPIFISFLASASGIHPTIVTHIIYACMVLILFYMLMKLIADVLVDREYVPLFLIFTSIMNLFGNDTIYLNSTFLLTRTAQGKAFLGNIIPAASLLGLLMVWKELSQKKEPRQKYAAWILLSCVMVTAVYTSLMGLVLAALLIGGVTVIFAIYHRNLKILFPCMFSMLPLAFIGVLYVTLLIQ